MAEENVLNKYNCATCGIAFGLDKNVEKLWRENRKEFLCPNGHSLSFKDPPKHESEINNLKIQVKELEGKLKSLQEDLQKKDQKIEELTSELEIWKPSDKT